MKVKIFKVLINDGNIVLTTKHYAAKNIRDVINIISDEKTIVCIEEVFDNVIVIL